MKVLHFSAMDGYTGAGGAATRIHLGLLARGVDSRFCVAYPTVDIENGFAPKVTLCGRAVRKARRAVDDRLVRRASKQFRYLLSSGACGFSIAKIVEQERPDIVQLHLLGFHAFRLATLAGVRAPVVWRFPDQWAFCGLTHYEPDPQNYIAPPRNRALIGRYTDYSEYVRARKAALYAQLDPLVAVCPSRWLAGEAARSALFKERRIEVIPTSCDTSVFLPKDRQACRAALGLSQTARLVLAGAGSLELPSKGIDLFVEAMTELCKGIGGSTEIVTFGKDPFNAARIGAPVQHMGHVTDRRLLSILYSAADVFVAPSRMENLANTVLESLACGTPVVAFDVGGMSDAVEHKFNGYLAAPFSTRALGEGVRWALQHPDVEALRAACRDKVLNCFSREQEIDRFISLYDDLLCARAAQMAPERPVKPLPQYSGGTAAD